jgi:predicted nucleotidyltransferase
MPVQKFRSIEDTPDPPWRVPGDPELYIALARLWEASRRMRPRQFPPGVYKHRSMEDMNRQQDEWDAAFVARVACQNRHVSVTFHPNGLQKIDSDAIDEVVRRVVRAFHPRRIVVFGSVARGEASPDSDLDLFIEMESDLRPVERGVAVRRALGDVRFPMDVFVYTPAEVADARTRFGNLMTFVDAEGRVVYES